MVRQLLPPKIMTDNHSSISIPGPILVTGASGFIGGHLCRQLVAQGHRVLGVTRSADAELPEGVERHVLDLGEEEQVIRLFEKENPQTIFHLAGHVVAKRGVEEVMPSFQCTLATTVHLLMAAQKHSKGRFIQIGSLEEPVKMGDPPASPYAASKAAASGYARMFHALYGLRVVIARVFMVYGPDQKDRKKLIPYVIDSLLKGESPRLSSGKRLVDWIHVADVVEGLIALAATPGIEGQTVDLGSGELVSVHSLVQRLAEITPSTGSLIYDPAGDRPMEQVRQANVDATASLTGWRPKFSLDEGLADTVRWHQDRHGKSAAPADKADSGWIKKLAGWKFAPETALFLGVDFWGRIESLVV